MKRLNIAYASFGLNSGTCIIYKRNKITAGKKNTYHVSSSFDCEKCEVIYIILSDITSHLYDVNNHCQHW